MNALDVRHLRLVQTVAECGTVTGAASALHLTQSAVSRQLVELEARLGVELFSRAKKRMTPTSAGQRILRTAGPMLEELRALEEDVARNPREAPVLRIATECYTCYRWLPSAFPELHRAQPELEVRIVLEATRRPLEALLRDEIDAAFIAVPTRDRRLATIPLFEDELVCVMHPSHPLASRPHLEPRHFAGETLFTYDLPAEQILILRQILGPAGVEPRRTLRVPLTEAILEMVAANLGISVFAHWSAAPYIASGAIVARRITRAGLHRTWSLAHARNRAMLPALQALARVLRRHDPGAARLGKRTSKPAEKIEKMEKATPQAEMVVA
ncbi:LysR family transcriptional regulator [Pendulispora albinea]|uniref:LysR family transcriptional regulator n=1 Tax=Pendulispora albinea TaxID=2741071 RepID=A0ABZ2LXX3_9BACT